MKRKLYERPSVVMVVLKPQTALLQASVQEKQVGVQNYTWQNVEEE